MGACIFNRRAELGVEGVAIAKVDHERAIPCCAMAGSALRPTSNYGSLAAASLRFSTSHVKRIAFVPRLNTQSDDRRLPGHWDGIEWNATTGYTSLAKLVHTDSARFLLGNVTLDTGVCATHIG